MSNKTEEQLRADVKFAMRWKPQCVDAAFDALADHIRARPTAELEICPNCDGSGSGVADTTCGSCDGSGGVPARPTFEGDEAEVREEVAKAIYLVHDMNGTEPKDSAHMRAVFGDNAREDFRHYGDRARKAAAAALAVVRALLDAKDAEIRKRDEALAAETELSEKRLEWFKNAESESHQYTLKFNNMTRERDEALAKVADRDAAIVEACRRSDDPEWDCGVDILDQALEFCIEPLRPFLPAPEPVSDPLVEEAREIWNCAVEAVPANIQAHSCPAAIEVIRAALAARGGKIVFEGEGK